MHKKRSIAAGENRWTGSQNRTAQRLQKRSQQRVFSCRAGAERLFARAASSLLNGRKAAKYLQGVLGTGSPRYIVSYAQRNDTLGKLLIQLRMDGFSQLK